MTAVSRTARHGPRARARPDSGRATGREESDVNVTPEDVFAWVQRVRDDGPGVWAVVDGLDAGETRDLVGHLLAYLCALTTAQDGAAAALGARFRAEPGMSDARRLAVLRAWLDALPLGTPGLAGVIRGIGEADADAA